MTTDNKTQERNNQRNNQNRRNSRPRRNRDNDEFSFVENWKLRFMGYIFHGDYMFMYLKS